MAVENMRAKIRALAVEGHNPPAAAEKLLADLSTKERLALLAEILPSYIRMTYSNQRRSAQSSVGGYSLEPPGTLGTLSSPYAVGTPKSARVRDSYADWLGSMLHCGKGVWKPLRDCTKADLLFAADERLAKAAQNAATAVLYQSLAEVVSTTLGDAPRAEVERVLSAVAA